MPEAKLLEAAGAAGRRKDHKLLASRLGLPILCILAGFPLLCPPAAEAQVFASRHLSREDGLPTDQVRCLLQDRRGFLWVGTGQGLARFDGREFRTYDSSMGLPAGPVRSIHETADGTLWVGTESGLAYREGQGFRVVSGWIGGGVLADGAMDSRDGTLYIASRRGLVRGATRPGGAFEILRAPIEAGPDIARSLFIDGAGAVWVTSGNTLCRVGRDGLEIVGRTAGLPDSSWHAVKRDAEGTLWVRDSLQVWFLRPGEPRFRKWQEESLTSGFAGLYLDPTGRMVIPGQGGVRFLSGYPVPFLGQVEGLTADHAANVLWDRNGNLWLGLPNDGLSMLRGKGRWAYWTHSQGLSSSAVTSVRRDISGQLWVGTRLGLNLLNSETGQWITFTRQNGLPQDEIRSLAVDRTGGLWIGSGLGGLARMDTRTRRIQVFGKEEGLANNLIATVDVDREDRVWVMTRDGVFRTNARGPWAFEPVSFPDINGDRQVYRIIQAGDGTLWAAGRQGLMRRRNGSWEVFGPEIGLRERSLVFLTEGPDRAIWIGYGHKFGVSRVEWQDGKPRVDHFGRPEALNYDDISFLETDRLGRIWVGTEKGVSVFDGRTWRRYMRDDGLVWNDMTLNAFAADEDGKVFIGTNRGLSIFHAQEPLEAQAPGPVTITSMRIRGQEVDPETAEMQWRDHRVEFELAVLDFTNQRDLRFRYRLLGFSDEWVESSQGKAVFQELAPGDYVFEATASLRNAPWGTLPTRHELRVLPPWWGTWWFRLLVAGAAAGAAWGAVRWTLRIHVRRQQRLEALVAERTASLTEATESARREVEARERAVREKERLEEQLIQSQKMEAVGRLAGGVAHDFNNLLTVINGYSELLHGSVSDPAARLQASEIRKAGDRAAQLTQQLLAFSRRQVLQPQVLDPNAVIRETVSMLRRLVGETIEIILRLAPDAGRVKVDPGQLQQVLINLAVNARDAMPRGGQLAIGTANARLEAGDGEFGEPVLAGRHVVLEIADTGIGMDEETRARIFEPFFTTKQIGKGTGLGLATVFGVVRQSGGQIRVESRPGEGTSFRLFFPETDEAPTVPRETAAADASPRGHETILAVEDQEEVRVLVREALVCMGYRLLEAGCGEEALEVSRRHEGPIDLLLTDIVMPGMSGQELAARMIAERGSLRVLYMSGYADSMLRDHGISPDDGFCYVAKPFSPAALVAEVRAALDRP